MKQKKVKLLPILLAVLLFFVTVGADPHMTYAATTAPRKPALVSVENVSAGITIKWKKVSNAKGYYVYRKELGSSFQRIATIKNKNTVSYTDKKVKSKTDITYIYTVRAYNGKVLSNYDTIGLRITRDIPVPIKLSMESFTIAVGSSFTVDAVVSGTSKKVTWSSSNTKVATVKNGTITAKKAGTATITAKANGNTAKCTVTVVKPAKASNYKKLYKDFLSKNVQVGPLNSYVPDYYYLVDIGVEFPVLFVEGKMHHYPNDNGTNVLFAYTISNNEVVEIVSIALLEFNGYVNYNKKYKSLYSHQEGPEMAIDELLPLYGTGLPTLHRAVKLPGPEYTVNYTFMEKDRTVSKSEYDQFVKKYFTGITKYKMLSNTAANRAKTFS